MRYDSDLYDEEFGGNGNLNRNKPKSEQISKEQQLEDVRRLKEENLTDTEKNDIFAELWFSLQAYVVNLLDNQFNYYFRKYTDDMKQEAAMAIYQALPHYDENKGAITTFLRPIIIHAGQEYITTFLLNTSTHYGIHLSKIRKAINEFEATGVEWTDYLLAEKLDIPLHTVRECLDKFQLSSTVHIDSSDFARENLADPDTWIRDPEGSLIAKAEKEAIDECVEKLSPRARKIVKMHYGFGCEKMSNTTIAEQTGIDKNKVVATLNSSNRVLKRMLLNEGVYYQAEVKDEINRACKPLNFIPKVSDDEMETARTLMTIDLVF